MLWILIKKEILETILDLRFVVASLLFLIFFPLGMYVNRVDYEQRLSNYQREHQAYRSRYGNEVSFFTEEVHGFRPPAVMSVFVSGLDPHIPDKVLTSRAGVYHAIKEAGIDNPISILFGRADFLFNVTFLVSLAALIFTFNSISGEKERGTLSLIIANPVSRSQILLSKILGSYVALLVPFVVSVGMALLILGNSAVVSLTHPEVLWPLSSLLGITLLFILCMLSLGVSISSFVQQSGGAIVLLFLVWVVMVLTIPGASAMLAEVVAPIETGNVIMLRKKAIADTLDSEFEEEVKAEKLRLAREFFSEFGLTVDEKTLRPILDGLPEEVRQEVSVRIRAQTPQFYNERSDTVSQLAEKYQKRLAVRHRVIDEEHRGKSNKQTRVAMNLARVSPVSCFVHLASNLSGTGIFEAENFASNAQRFQNVAQEVVYDNYIKKGDIYHSPAGINLEKPHSLPDMEYMQLPLSVTLRKGWPDVVILWILISLFYGLAQRNLSYYDVR